MDANGDGYCDSGGSLISSDADCDGASTTDDCDDNDATRSPNFAEICGNTIDEDCDDILDNDCWIDSHTGGGVTIYKLSLRSLPSGHAASWYQEQCENLDFVLYLAIQTTGEAVTMLRHTMLLNWTKITTVAMFLVVLVPKQVGQISLLFMCPMVITKGLSKQDVRLPAVIYIQFVRIDLQSKITLQLDIHNLQKVSVYNIAQHPTNIEKI